MKKSVKFFGDKQRMKPFMHQFALGAVAMAMVQIANAAVAITNVVPMQIPGQGTEIRVMFNGIPPQPQAYQVEQPSRLILDFDKAAQTLQKTSIPVSTAEASSVDLAADAQRARLTVNLKDAGAFTTRVEGNTFILKINNAATATPQTFAAAAMPVAQGVTNVDFHRGDKGEGQVIIDLSNPNTPVDVKQQGSKIVVRFLGNKIPTALARRLNVNDFATPVSSVDAFNEGRNGTINIQSNGSFDYMAYQTDNRLVISVAKKEEKAVTNTNQLSANNRYTGKKISLDFQDIEVRRVLQLLADFTGVNIVASDTVQGNITLRLKDVPWDQALDIIMKSKNLDKRKNGNVIWIAPTAELIKSDEDQAKALAQHIKLAPLQSETMQLNYVQAEDVKKMIDDNNNKVGRSSDEQGMRSLLSSRGSIIVDSRTNTLIMNDTAEKVEQLKNIIKQIDSPVKQVMIEARIVRATTSFSKSIGVKWGFLSNKSTPVASTTDNVNALSPAYSALGGSSTSSTNNLNVDLGASGSTTGSSPASIAFGLINTADTLLTLELSALQADGQGEVISTPKVMTGDKQEATIKSGTKVPYSTTSANSGTTTTFQDANLELNVTPSITPDGNVQMKLKITKDTVGSLTSAGYVIDTNAVQTNILVNNGETVVLGGIYEDTRQKDVSKVPFLGDLPLIGNLFKSTTSSNTKNELLIFITPRIVDDTVSRNH